MAASVLWAPCYGVLRAVSLQGKGTASSQPGPKLGFGSLWVVRSDSAVKTCRQAASLSSQFMVYEVPGQDLEVDLYDEDTDKDDFLGR